MLVFLDFDGTMHPGHAVIDREGRVTCEDGGKLLRFAPLLLEALEPYPEARIVLTTNWLNSMPFETVKSFLPETLQARVIGHTKRFFSQQLKLREIYSYPREDEWVAIDDNFGELVLPKDEWRLIRTETSKGLGDDKILGRLEGALITMHRFEKEQ